MNKLLQQSNMHLAETLTKKLGHIESVETILLYGSVGKGYSDDRSDIDLVLISSLPHEEIMGVTNKVEDILDITGLVFKEQELSVLQFDEYPSLVKSQVCYPSLRASLCVKHDDRMIDTTVRFVSVEVLQNLVADAKKNMYVYQTLIQYIGDTRILFDRTSNFYSLKKEIESFRSFAPDLYRLFISHCIDRLNYYMNGEIPDSIIRGDVVVRTVELSKGIILFLNVLYAINDRCLTYPKWEQNDIEQLALQPKHTHERLRRVIGSQDPELLAQLGRELFTLIPGHVV